MHVKLHICNIFPDVKYTKINTLRRPVGYTGILEFWSSKCTFKSSSQTRGDHLIVGNEANVSFD